MRERLDGNEVRILSEKINAGDRMAEAFQAARFSRFECHLIAAGEKGGQMDKIFEHLSEYWTQQLHMRQAMLRPLWYPFVVMHLAVAVGALVQYLAESSMTNAVSRAVLTLVTAYAVIFIVYTLIKATWSNESAQRFWQALPLIGGTLKAAYAYRWITAMRIEFNAGISLASAVGDAWRASGYVGAAQLAAEGEQGMREGRQLSQLVQGWKRLPNGWVDFIETGELSGKMDEAFKNLEAEASRNWSLAQGRLIEWLPKITYFVVLLIVAAQVGFVIYQATVAPIIHAEDVIDKATH